MPGHSKRPGQLDRTLRSALSRRPDQDLPKTKPNTANNSRYRYLFMNETKPIPCYNISQCYCKLVSRRNRRGKCNTEPESPGIRCLIHLMIVERSLAAGPSPDFAAFLSSSAALVASLPVSVCPDSVT